MTHPTPCHSAFLDDCPLRLVLILRYLLGPLEALLNPSFQLREDLHSHSHADLPYTLREHF